MKIVHITKTAIIRATEIDVMTEDAIEVGQEAETGKIGHEINDRTVEIVMTGAVIDADKKKRKLENRKLPME